MNDLVAFLRARLDEREAVAQAAAHGASGRWVQPRGDEGDGRASVEYGSGEDDWPDRADNGIVIYDEGAPTPEQAAHIALNDPAHVLAEVEAKRRILDRYEDCLSRLESPDFEIAARDQVREYEDFVLPSFATPFAAHPDYREEWRP